jgi:transcriptional regulator with GAF, ATPase, and Fis domain
MFRDITDRVLLEKERAHLVAQNEYLREEIKSTYNFEEIIGSSAGLKRALDNVRRVAPTNASVLILGETGTGKELIARAIHSASKRADKPFVKVNCAALPPSLIESELFGHERGAFSGALQKRVGRFELAHQGTMFLDEIGEMPLDVQVKLLRVLQEHQLNRLGSNETIETDVRVIAATNRNLPAAVTDGTFRSDLYYRLNVFPIQLPALRERACDIAELAGFFVQKYAPQLGTRVETICPDSLRRLALYTWPGNNRELENVIQRALILEESTVLAIDPGALSVPPATGNDEDRQPRPDARVADHDEPPADLNRIQREHIITVLRDSGWVVEGDRGAAIRLGMKPATLRHRMKKLSIERPKAAF